MEIKIYENEIVEDIPIVPPSLETHDHDGFNSELLKASSFPEGIVQMFFQATAPTSGMATGDYWIDSDDNKIYRYSGTAWVEIQDDQIAAAIANAATAQSTADSKIITFIQTSAPTATDTGDIWFDNDDNNKPYRWSGSAWVAAEFDVATWAKIIGVGKPMNFDDDGIKVHVVGDVLMKAADTEKQPGTGKVKEIRLTRGGTYRIKFDMKNTTTPSTITGQIYRNGVAVGTLQTQTNVTPYTTYSEDISGWSAGDLCQIYYGTTSAGAGFFKNFRIYVKDCDESEVTLD